MRSEKADIANWRVRESGLMMVVERKLSEQQVAVGGIQMPTRSQKCMYLAGVVAPYRISTFIGNRS
jgi:hypothetical protein